MADQHFSVPGGIQHNRASAYAQEMAKWEMDSHEYGTPGRPRAQIGVQPYPAMFYRVEREETGGGVKVLERAVADDETMARNLLSRGFHNGLQAAADALAATEQESAKLAAERNFHERRMSDRARAEAEAADDATVAHLPEVPTTPINPKRGVDQAPKKSDLVK